MKIKPNFTHYVIPGLVGVILLIASVSNGAFSFVLGVIVLAMCAIHRSANYVEVNNGLLTKTSGLSKVSSPVNKIQYCEYSGIGCFNRIHINCVTGDYRFHNMTKAKEFTEYVNRIM